MSTSSSKRQITAIQRGIERINTFAASFGNKEWTGKYDIYGCPFSDVARHARHTMTIFDNLSLSDKALDRDDDSHLYRRRKLCQDPQSKQS